MPNWCNNKLIIKGTKDKLEEFIHKHFNNNNELDFATIVPEEYDQDGDIWYAWRVRNWGTKWNACYVDIAWIPDTLIIMYDTAWTPNIPITIKLFELYPELEITHTYYEGGMDIAGKLTREGNYESYNTKQFALDEGFITEEDYAELL